MSFEQTPTAPEQTFSFDASRFPLTVTQHEAGQRLDAVLKMHIPHMGVRGIRRLWDWCDVRVNNKPAKPGHELRPNDYITLNPKQQASTPVTDAPPPCSAAEQAMKGIYLAAANGPWYALFKPHGLHTAQLAGGNQPSLEGLLATHWAAWQQAYAKKHGLPCTLVAPPALVTRLDAATAGLVLATTSHQQQEQFRQAERQALVEKTYYALVHGAMPTPLLLTNALDTNNRSVTKVLEADTADSTRHTCCEPLALLSTAQCLPLFAAMLGGTPLAHSTQPHGPQPQHTFDEAVVATLVRVTIRRGARHQIRTHLAHAGFALVGDALYSNNDGQTQEKEWLTLLRQNTPHPVAWAGQGVANNAMLPQAYEPRQMPLFLHHAKVHSPFIEAEAMPLWVPEQTGTFFSGE